MQHDPSLLERGFRASRRPAICIELSKKSCVSFWALETWQKTATQFLCLRDWLKSYLLAYI